MDMKQSWLIHESKILTSALNVKACVHEKFKVKFDNFQGAFQQEASKFFLKVILGFI